MNITQYIRMVCGRRETFKHPKVFRGSATEPVGALGRLIYVVGHVSGCLIILSFEKWDGLFSRYQS